MPPSVFARIVNVKARKALKALEGAENKAGKMLNDEGNYSHYDLRTYAMYMTDARMAMTQLLDATDNVKEIDQ